MYKLHIATKLKWEKSAEFEHVQNVHAYSCHGVKGARSTKLRPVPLTRPVGHRFGYAIKIELIGSVLLSRLGGCNASRGDSYVGRGHETVTAQ